MSFSFKQTNNFLILFNLISFSFFLFIFPFRSDCLSGRGSTSFKKNVHLGVCVCICVIVVANATDIFINNSGGVVVMVGKRKHTALNEQDEKHWIMEIDLVDTDGKKRSNFFLSGFFSRLLFFFFYCIIILSFSLFNWDNCICPAGLKSYCILKQIRCVCFMWILLNGSSAMMMMEKFIKKKNLCETDDDNQNVAGNLNQKKER